jgi:hypothetical protein
VLIGRGPVGSLDPLKDGVTALAGLQLPDQQPDLLAAVLELALGAAKYAACVSNLRLGSLQLLVSLGNFVDEVAYEVGSFASWRTRSAMC